MKQCEEIRFTPKSEVNDYLRAIGYEPLKEGISVRDLLKRPNITLAALQPYTGMQVEEKAARPRCPTSAGDGSDEDPQRLRLSSDGSSLFGGAAEAERDPADDAGTGFADLRGQSGGHRRAGHGAAEKRLNIQETALS